MIVVYVWSVHRNRTDRALPALSGQQPREVLWLDAVLEPELASPHSLGVLLAVATVGRAGCVRSRLSVYASTLPGDPTIGVHTLPATTQPTIS